MALCPRQMPGGALGRPVGFQKSTTGPDRRRRDLAVLKTLGLSRSQVSSLAGAALLVGLPVGALAGRWSWALFAGSIGVAGQASVPLPLILLAIPAALLLANLIAAAPGWAAARIRPAYILRCAAANTPPPRSAKQPRSAHHRRPGAEQPLAPITGAMRVLPPGLRPPSVTTLGSIALP